MREDMKLAQSILKTCSDRVDKSQERREALKLNMGEYQSYMLFSYLPVDFLMRHGIKQDTTNN